MARFTYLQAIYSSFYSSDLYRDIKDNWGADVLLYLLMVLGICWAVSTVFIQIAINTHYNKFADIVAPQLPIITIKKGLVSTPENRPYYIKGENNKDFAVIDTSGQVTTLKDTDAQFLLTNHEIMSKNNENEIRTRTISESINVEFVPVVVKEQLRKIVHFAWIIVFPVCLFISFIYRILQAVLYALLGMLFSVLSAASLSYINLLKLSVVAITPSIIIVTILNCFSIQFRLMWLVFFVMSMGYVVFAIRANNQKMKNQ